MSKRTEQRLIELIKLLPQQQTKGEDMAYCIGYLMGIISKLGDQDSHVDQAIKRALERKREQKTK